MTDTTDTGPSPEALEILAASNLNPDGSPIAAAAGDEAATELKAKPAAADTGKDAPADSAADETKDKPADEQPAKPKKSYQERMDDLTRARREAERERDELKAEVAAIRAAAAEAGEGEIDDSYIDQLVEQRLQERENRKAAEAANATFTSRMAVAADKYDDFVEKVHQGAASDAWACTPDMLAAIRESEIAGELSYHLATNPDESRRIAALSPHSQIRELGKLEAKLSATEETPPPAAEKKPAPKTVTTAPAPAPQTRGAGGAFKVAADTNDFAAFDAQYAIKT